MYKLCKTEQSARRQRKLEDGLLEAMLHQRYEDISVSSLCDQLGVPRKAFYRYFDSKDGALIALIDHHLMAYEGTNLWSHGFAIDLDAFFEFWVCHQLLLDALHRSGISGMLVERAIHNTQEALIFDMPGYSPEYVAATTTFAVSGLMSLMLAWHRDGYRQSPAEMAAMARRMLGTALVPGLK